MGSSANTRERSVREVELHAEAGELVRAREFADEVTDALGFDDDGRFAIRMAVSEVVANAVEHGSSSSEDVVRLRAVEEDGALVMYVTDVGTFIPPEALMEDALRERGRGMSVIRWLTDEFDVRSGYEGTVTRFAKRFAA
jgi:anti-sigma regulatory factor (Ser/Thr protein kinase)